VLGDVPELGEERDVLLRAVLAQPAQRGDERGGFGAVGVEEVLRVGQDGQREPR
jgi:hypothetical protein